MIECVHCTIYSWSKFPPFRPLTSTTENASTDSIFHSQNWDRCVKCSACTSRYATRQQPPPVTLAIGRNDTRFLYTQARIEYGNDKVIADDPKNVIASVDQETVTILFRLKQFKETIFTKRLRVYNKTFALNGGSSKLPVFASLWHEGIAGRKEQDLISCYHSFLLFYRNFIYYTTNTLLRGVWPQGELRKYSRGSF